MAMVDVEPPVHVSTAKGVLSLLEEPQDELKVAALNQLQVLVDTHWTEVAEFLPVLESLYEDDEFPSRALAALVASKVFYHLGELSDALTYALGAGDLFDVRQHSEFVDTLVSKAIDQYIAQRTDKDARMDDRLEAIVNRMFDRCFVNGKFKQALGIALECHRLDMVKRAVSDSGNLSEMLSFCFRVSLTQVRNREFRQQVLKELTQLFPLAKDVDYTRLSQCFMLLGDHAATTNLLVALVESEDTTQILTAFQVAFDLVDNATQEFLLQVSDGLPKPPAAAAAAPAAPAPDAQPAADSAPMDIEQDEVAPEEKKKRLTYERLRDILAGHVTVQHQMDFLHRHCHSDMQILRNVKGSVEVRSSALYTALVSCNGIMHAGTTNDTFLRKNLDWLRQAKNWAKFGAIGSLGLIRHGQVKEGMTLLKDFLPAQTGQAQEGGGGEHQEGGALYALGMINAERGQHVVPYLLECLRQANGNEVVQHGACLGLGLAAFATSNMQVYEELKAVLFTDNTIAGKAAGLAMGLVMCGSGNQTAIDEMLHYAHDTQKEKIIRSLSLGLAVIMYGREEGADTLIEQMAGDKDSVVRYGCMYLVAMAYAATADNKAIRRLLHVAVSDVSDDVRRAAVLALGFVLANEHEECPKVVSLLAESYNPHVRYGAAMAVGISCAGTGLSSAIALLQPMTKDAVDFVRQAAHIALAMVLIQVSDAQSDVVKGVRDHLYSVVQDKHEEMLAKFGAILAVGIIDAGGRNATISLKSDSGFTKMGAVVGMAVFTQFWYWYPFSNFLGLAIKPTAIIALNSDLNTPKVAYKSNAPASRFAYPPDVQPVVQRKGKKGPKAVLSTTKKQLAKEKAKRGDKEEDGEGAKGEGEDVKMEGEGDQEKGEDKEKDNKKEEPEEPFQMLDNPARVTTPQQQHIEFVLDQRYIPVRTDKVNGIILVRDTQPDQEQDLVAASIKPAVAVPAREEDEVEPDLPAPFRWP